LSLRSGATSGGIGFKKIKKNDDGDGDELIKGGRKMGCSSSSYYYYYHYIGYSVSLFTSIHLSSKNEDDVCTDGDDDDTMHACGSGLVEMIHETKFVY